MIRYNTELLASYEVDENEQVVNRKRFRNRIVRIIFCDGEQKFYTFVTSLEVQDFTVKLNTKMAYYILPKCDIFSFEVK